MLYWSNDPDIFSKKKEHLCVAKKNIDNNYFHNAIRKYGEENFEWSIIEDGITHINKLNWYEESCIAYYNTLAPNGYNLHTGGLNHICSEETKQKLSKSHMGAYR